MKKHTNSLVSSSAVSLTLLCCAAMGHAVEEQPKGIRDNAEKSFAYTGEDITRLPTRIGFSYDSGVNHNTGSNTDSYLLTGSLSLFGLQALAEVPVYQRYNPGAGATENGFGDSFVSGAFALPLNPKLRLAVGCDALLDTSSENALGPNETLYSPFLGIGLEQSEQSMFVGKLSYTGSSHDNYERWELLLRGLHRWDDKLFSSVDAIPGWDSKSDELLLNARILAGARIDRHHVASIEFELPIDSDSRDSRGSNLRLNYNFLF